MLETFLKGEEGIKWGGGGREKWKEIGKCEVEGRRRIMFLFSDCIG